MVLREAWPRSEKTICLTVVWYNLSNNHLSDRVSDVALRCFAKLHNLVKLTCPHKSTKCISARLTLASGLSLSDICPCCVLACLITCLRCVWIDSFTETTANEPMYLKPMARALSRRNSYNGKNCRPNEQNFGFRSVEKTERNAGFRAKVGSELLIRRAKQAGLISFAYSWVCVCVFVCDFVCDSVLLKRQLTSHFYFANKSIGWKYP